MLGCIEVVLKFNILYQGKEKPVKTKLMPAKLRADLACAESIIREYLRENESFSKTILAWLSGAHVG